MRQVVIPRFGGPEVLEVREAPDPTPGAGEVRIAVGAAGLNFADVVARRGQYPDAPPLPMVMGYEVGGTIDAVGPGVDPALLGRKTAALCRFKGHSSAVVVPEGQLFAVPSRMNDAQAAALPVAWLTSWVLLHEMGRVRKGDKVLIHNVAGGVGLVSLAICRDVGAEVWGRCGKSKHEQMLALGCDHVLDSHADEWPKEGMDLILDPIGGASWGKGLDCLAPTGRLAVFGFSAQTGGWRLWGTLKAAAAVPWRRMSPVGLIDANLGVLGVNMGHLWGHADRVRGWLGHISEALVRMNYTPHIHTQVPFDQAAEAHRMLEGRGTMGKVVLVP